MKNIFLLVFMHTLIMTSQSPVEKHGRLKAVGNRIVGEDGKEAQLKGMSLFWSQWMGQFYNYDVVKWLRDDWNCSVVRAAMAIEYDGYLDNKEQEMQKVLDVVDAAIDLGIYVIIDWHDHRAENHLEEAQGFFEDMARRYAAYPNVIYEIYNEPLRDISWKKVIKPYNEAVIGSIRRYDSLNLIVCGTRSWSQDVDEASEDPIEAYNIAYALHYYASTHKQWLRDKAQKALDNGIALFVTEYGTCFSDGNGAIDFTENLAWWKFMDENKISYCNWSVADKDETSAALLPGAHPLGGWDTTMLSVSGLFVRGWLRGYDLSGILNNGLKDNGSNKGLNDLPAPGDKRIATFLPFGDNFCFKAVKQNIDGCCLQHLPDK